MDALASPKKIVIAETQYPWTLANGNSPLGDSTGNFVWEPSQLSTGYPASPGGQLSFVTDELSILAQVPGGLGAGLFLYRAPDWIPGVPWKPGAGIGSANAGTDAVQFQGRGPAGWPAAPSAARPPVPELRPLGRALRPKGLSAVMVALVSA